MNAAFHASDKCIDLSHPSAKQSRMPRRRSLVTLIALVLIALGLMTLPRPTLYYPNVVIDVTEGMQLDFLLNGLQDKTTCEAEATSIANAITASCAKCSPRIQRCLQDLPTELRQRFDETPLPIPSARMTNGIVTYNAAQAEIAQLACQESERQAVLRGDQSKVTCYSPGAARNHLLFEKQHDRSAYTTFTLLLAIVGALIAALAAAILVTYYRYRRPVASARSRSTLNRLTLIIHPWLETLTLAGIDTIILLCVFLALSWPTTADINRWGHLDRATVLTHGVAIVLTVAWFGLLLEHYTRRRPFWDELREITRVLAAMFMVSGAAAFVGGIEIGRTNHLVVWGLAFLLIPLGRSGAKQLLQDLGLWQRPAVIIGTGDSAQAAIGALQNDPSMGYRVVALFTLQSGDSPLPPDHWAKDFGLTAHSVGNDIEETLVKMGHPQIFVALENPDAPDATSIIHRLIDSQHHVHLIPRIQNLPLLGAHFSPFMNQEIALLTFRSNLRRTSVKITKRTIDLLFSAIGLLISTPIILTSAITIYLISPRNPFYSQTREGYLGKDVRVWKLRTMHHNAEQLLDRHLKTCPAAKEEWDRYFKLTDDPRILPFIGTFLRTSSIDELPQLVNVLLGDLSLVGPRPFPHYHLESFSNEFRALRRQVKPGITGMWQVHARSNGDIKVQEYYDTYYIRNWSMWLDCYILFKTPGAVASGRGAK